MRRLTATSRRDRLRGHVVLGLAAAAAVAVATGLPAAPAHAVPAAAGGGREAHVANPYVGSRGYVNPEWRALAESEPGGSRVSSTPTGIWVDDVSDIAGTAGAMGLRAHLDAALAQGANLVQVVLDDLPGRYCSRQAVSGDFPTGQLDRYRREFVDPVAAIESDPRYGSLRIVNVVEGNALAEIATGSNQRHCPEAEVQDDYVKGIRYALDQLHPYSNVYTYLGVGGYTWLGWTDATAAGLEMLRRALQGTSAGLDSIDGVISNLTGYSPLKEPFISPRQSLNGTLLLQSKWIDWNNYTDELSFAPAFRAKLVAAGFPSDVSVLVDTSRNGWGGPARPTRPSTSTDVDTYVDASRVDRRPSYDVWCNQVGAGLGERPVATPAPGIDAYVWMTPPGISDGASTWSWNSDYGDIEAEPMCSPRYYGSRGNGHPTGALDGAPARGSWFPAAFRQLMANAYPALP